MAEDILKKITDQIRLDEGESLLRFEPARWAPATDRMPKTLPEILAPGFLTICELKKASPSKGLIRKDFEVASLAKAYERGGARALSVLTEKNFFLGEKRFLTEVRTVTDLPLLRKDFIFHPAQVYEARDLGADLVLLIAAMLDDGELHDLHELAVSLGMTPLVEVHDERERDRVLTLKPRLLGINNRSLHTFQTDFETAFRLKTAIPDSIPVIAESGIETTDQMKRLKGAGFAGALVGESLMRQPDVEVAVRQLVSGLAAG